MIIVSAATVAADSRDVAPPTSLANLYSSIQAQESNFPLPQTTQTITVATIDVSEASSSEPTIKYSIPTYYSGTHPIAKRGPCLDSPTPPHHNPHFLASTADASNSSQGQGPPVVGSGPCITLMQVPNAGGQLTVANILHLNIAFTITGWRASGTTLTVSLGPQAPQTVPYGATRVVFSGVTDTTSPLTVTLNGGLISNGVPIPVTATGVLPLTVSWLTLGAGAITIPVLPISIVYAPVVDAQQKNTASAATGISSSNTTTLSFSSQVSTTTPVDANFQNVSEIEQGANAIAPVLQKIPNGIANGVGTALGALSQLLGSSSATQTNTSVSAAQNTLQVGTSQTVTLTALASQGGPGVGDLFTYYYNARVVWYSNGGEMRLAVLGFDGTVQVTAGKLTSAWLALKNRPAGSIDPVSHLNADSLYALLSLDPFFNGTARGNPGAQLPGPRFVDVSNGFVEIAGGQRNQQFTHQISTTDVKTQQVTQMNSDTDKAGFLSFLGIGVTDTHTIQTTISQGTSLQNTVGQNATENFTFFDNGNESYTCEVYYDVVFGSFAFRVLTAGSMSPVILGSIVDAQGKAIPNLTVTATAASKTFVTATDPSGKFSFRLDGSQLGMVKLSSSTPGKKAEAQVEADRHSTRTVRLQLR